MTALNPPDRIWAKVRGAYQTLPGRSSYVIGSFEARPDDKATEYIRSDLVPSWNRDMSAAPKDAPILAWCDHDADPYEMGRTSDGRSKLTLYAAHAEGLWHAGTGYRIIEWGDGWNPKIESSPLEKMIFDVIEKKVREQVIAHIETALQERMDEAGKLVASEIIQKAAEKTAPLALTAFVQGSTELATMNALNVIRSELRNRGLPI